MQRKSSNIKELLLHVSSFLLHDLDEISKLQNASHSNIDAFVASAYKKVFFEIRKGLRSIYRHSIINPWQEIVPFSSFHENGKLNILNVINNSNENKSISDIALEMGRKDFNNTGEIDYLFVNPISNIPSFTKGMKNFTLNVAMCKKNSDDQFSLQELYIYNPISHELITFKDKQGVTLNDYRLQARDIFSIRDAFCGLVTQNIKNLAKMPKDIIQAKHIVINDDFPTLLSDFLSGKIDVLLHLNADQSDWIVIDLMTKLGYIVHPINHGKINFEEQLSRQGFDNEIHDSIAIATRKTMNIISKLSST